MSFFHHVTAGCSEVSLRGRDFAHRRETMSRKRIKLRVSAKSALREKQERRTLKSAGEILVLLSLQ
jgi:hypothetical protein